MQDERNSSKQLAQLRPSGTSATTAYQPPANKEAHVDKIVCCNTTGSDAGAYVYHDADGTTYSADTAMLSNESVAANHAISIEFENALVVDEEGAIGVKQGTGGAINFTVIGRLVDKK